MNAIVISMAMSPTKNKAGKYGTKSNAKTSSEMKKISSAELK